VRKDREEREARRKLERVKRGKEVKNEEMREEVSEFINGCRNDSQRILVYLLSRSVSLSLRTWSSFQEDLVWH
jgi:hypothetical protein